MDPLQWLLLIGTVSSLVGLVIVTIAKRKSGCRCRTSDQHYASNCSGKLFEIPRVCLLLAFIGTFLGLLVTLRSW